MKDSSNIAQKDIEQNNGSYGIYGASGYIKDVDFYKQDKPYIAVVKDGAGIGRTMLLPEKTSVIGTMQYLIPNDLVSVEYLYYAVTYMNLSKYFTGATIPHIYFKDYQKEKLPLPSKKDQQQIANILQKVDYLIELSKIAYNKLDMLVKSRFVEMFDDTKDKCTISEVCSIITDGTHQPPKFTKIGIPFLFVSNIATNEISYNTEKFISEETYNELYKRTPIEIGDIVLSTVGSYGHPAVVKKDKRFLFQRHIAYLKPIASIVNSTYLHSAILSRNVQEQIEDRVKGIAQKTLNLSEIRKIAIPLPPIDLQNQFADFVTKTDKSKYCIRLSLKNLCTIHKNLIGGYSK